MLSPGRVLRAARDYVRDNPSEIGRAIRSAVGLRVGVPIAAFRWLVDEMLDDEKKADMEVEIEARPPGIWMSANLDLDDTRVRASATVCIDQIRLSIHEMRIEVRLEDINMTVLSEKKTQLAALIRSGALDVSQPGALVAELPDMPDVIADAQGNRIVLDLMRLPQLRDNKQVRQIVGALSSIVTIHSFETDDAHLDVGFRAFPEGFMNAAESVGDHLIEPGLRKAREAWKNADEGDGRGSRLRRMLSLTSGL